jgi:MoaA/NifB/PqqE/SkfB family radical SAM enzyme
MGEDISVVLHVSKYLDGLDRKCNHDCLFCIERMEPNSSAEEISDLLFLERALDEAKNRFETIHTIYIAGGEPTMREDIADIVGMAANYKSNVCLSSNCDYPNQDIINKLIKAGITQVATSIHGSSEKIHDYLTQKEGSFKNTLNTINDFIKKGISVHVNYVVCSANINEMKKTVEMFEHNPYKIKKLVFTHYVNHGNAYYYPKLHFNVDEYTDTFRELLDIVQTVPFEVKLRDFPLCIDDRMRKYQESVENIYILEKNNEDVSVLPEKAPSNTLKKCNQCEMFYECPKYLYANYFEGNVKQWKR